MNTEIFNAYKEHINAYPEENRQGALAMKEVIERSPLNANGTLDKTVHIPKVFDRKAIEDFEKIAAQAGTIFGKVMEEYRRCADFRALFPFDRRLEELILLPRQYEGSLPMARFDIFYNEETRDFMFCEINTDGTAAMVRDLELRKTLAHNPAHRAVSEQYRLQPFELFDSWVEAFMELYGTWPKNKEDPFVAITDFLENATMGDFYEFEASFRKAGIRCGICDIRSLKYDDGGLHTEDGVRIDAIYRRAVTADVMAHYDEVPDFLHAVSDDAVFVAGAFDTQIIHSKWIFHVLHLKRTLDILTGEEQDFVKKHIPFTARFSPEYISLKEVRERKDEWIIKPMDAYASKGVYAAGREYTREQWEEITGGLYGQGYICQQYCPQYLTENIDFAWGDGKWHPYINMPGLYVYNGKFAGILMRMACGEKIIVAHENERTVPVFRV